MFNRLTQLIFSLETRHQEDKETIKSFLDIFNIAKKKILNFDENELAGSLKTSMNLMGNQNWQQEREFVQEIQNIGLFIDHFSYFKAIRNPRLERYATETNQLIIRLNKLLTDRPIDPSLIKMHEQNVRFYQYCPF